ncbi:MAG TPA: transglutaminase-like cysteine peptidase [Devosia sp.]|nr:transglutaminase-like cysteine peptidase [Devosia sp.]
MWTIEFVRRAMAVTLTIGMIAAAPVARAAQLVDFSNVAFAPVTGTTSIPVGAADFCKRFPGDCRINAKLVDAMHLTPQNWQQLLDVNTWFNTTIVPETDQQLYHVAEFWTYPNGYGDCEDIALAKRRQLIADGWPPSTLLMTVARDSDGEGHAVLMVRTDRGDLILDNQDSVVRDWKDSPYHFLKRQSQADAGEWVGIEDARPSVIVAGK